jgi:uncharacterized protein YcbX
MTTVTITELNVYPIKSCGGFGLPRATILESGLEYDRTFMLVQAEGDQRGRFVTQRSHPRMALIKTAYKLGMVVVRAPGMMRLDLPLDSAGEPLQVTVWNDTLMALDMGDVAAQWFSDFMGMKLRLARFDPQVSRPVKLDRIQAPTTSHQFGDGYPLLVVSQASLDDLNQRLVLTGDAPVPMNRFRPNIVISGVDAFEEDYITTLRFGDVELAFDRECGRCEIPNTDQDTSDRFDQPMRTLATYRSKASLQGYVCVGMNAVITAGAELELAVGQSGVAELNL